MVGGLLSRGSSLSDGAPRPAGRVMRIRAAAALAARAVPGAGAWPPEQARAGVAVDIQPASKAPSASAPMGNVLVWVMQDLLCQTIRADRGGGLAEGRPERR